MIICSNVSCITSGTARRCWKKSFESRFVTSTISDGAAKILLSTKGTMDDVAPDMKAFLEYVDGNIVDDDFVQEIDREIKNIKGQESERVSYMTYAMKIQEERDEARAEGRSETIIHSVRQLMQTTGWPIEKAMKAIGVPEIEWEQYKAPVKESMRQE